MSSYVSIGFVFDKTNDCDKVLDVFLRYLEETNILFQQIKYCMDPEGICWCDKDTNLNRNEIIKVFKNYHFVCLEADYQVLFHENVHFLISIQKLSEKDFGILMEAEYAQIDYVERQRGISEVVNDIIVFCRRIHSYVNYVYAFCDHEVPIEYTAEQYLAMDKTIYSISIVHKDMKESIFLENWEIDGHRRRYL